MTWRKLRETWLIQSLEFSLSELKVQDLDNHHWMLGSLLKE